MYMLTIALRPAHNCTATACRACARKRAFERSIAAGWQRIATDIASASLPR